MNRLSEKLHSEPLLHENGQFSFKPYEFLHEDKSIMEKFKESSKYVGEYSEDSQVEFSDRKIGRHILNAALLPNKNKMVEFDLKVGINKAGTYSGSEIKHFENFLLWITKKEDVFLDVKKEDDLQRVGGNFIASNQGFLKILNMPYINDIEQSFYATYVSGSIYLMDTRPDARPRNSRFAAAFHKFVQYMCSEDVTKSTVPNEKLRGVISSKLVHHDFLHQMEIFASDSKFFNEDKKDLSWLKHLRSKCYFTIDRNNFFKRIESFYWATQMAVTGAKELIAGYFKADLVVFRLQQYTLEELQSIGKGYWNLEKNFTFAADFLDFVKKETEANPEAVFIFKNSSAKNVVTCEKVEKDILPEWYVKKLKA